MAHFQYVPKDNDSFILEENGQRIAEMVVNISDGKISVYHTGVDEHMQGKGIGSQLVQEMGTYARANQLKVIPYCPFVLAKFRRNPDQFADVWEKESRESKK